MTQQDIVNLLSTGKISAEEANRRLNELNSTKKLKPEYYVSPTSGCLCVRNITGQRSRYPISLYEDQWRAIFEHKDEILKQLDENHTVMDKIRASKAAAAA